MDFFHIIVVGLCGNLRKRKMEVQPQNPYVFFFHLTHTQNIRILSPYCEILQRHRTV